MCMGGRTKIKVVLVLCTSCCTTQQVVASQFIDLRICKIVYFGGACLMTGAGAAGALTTTVVLLCCCCAWGA